MRKILLLIFIPLILCYGQLDVMHVINSGPLGSKVQNTTTYVYAGTPQIIVDFDWGTDADDIGGLAILHILADSGYCNILAIGNCQYNNYGAISLNTVNTYYGRSTLPIGDT